jgi:hypothetical protein
MWRGRPLGIVTAVLAQPTKGDANDAKDGTREAKKAEGSLNSVDATAMRLSGAEDRFKIA